MKEEWKAIPGYEGLYEVSNLGRVKGTKILRDRLAGKGYRTVTLCKNGKQKPFYVHRLVATAFRDKPCGCDVVNHIDNNPENNVAENLEWVTQRENVRHAAFVGVRTIRKIERTNGTEVVTYPTMHEVESDGFSSKAVRACCRGEKENYKGYIWRYIDESKQQGQASCLYSRT